MSQYNQDILNKDEKIPLFEEVQKAKNQETMPETSKYKSEQFLNLDGN